MIPNKYAFCTVSFHVGDKFNNLASLVSVGLPSSAAQWNASISEVRSTQANYGPWLSLLVQWIEASKAGHSPLRPFHLLPQLILVPSRFWSDGCCPKITAAEIPARWGLEWAGARSGPDLSHSLHGSSSVTIATVFGVFSFKTTSHLKGMWKPPPAISIK